MTKTTGRCLRGALRYEFEGEPEIILCHCESCRRHTSSPVATFLMVEVAALRLTHGEPEEFASSPGVPRGFCADCGSPIAYRSDRRPEIVDLYLGTLSDPTTAQPCCHVHSSEQISWFEVLDDLPRFEASRRGATPIRHGPRR